jgi:hypothetical protein
VVVVQVVVEGGGAATVGEPGLLLLACAEDAEDPRPVDTRASRLLLEPEKFQ